MEYGQESFPSGPNEWWGPDCSVPIDRDWKERWSLSLQDRTIGITELGISKTKLQEAIKQINQYNGPFPVKATHETDVYNGQVK